MAATLQHLGWAGRALPGRARSTIGASATQGATAALRALGPVGEQGLGCRYLLVLASLSTLVTASPTSAVCLKPKPKVCAEYFKSDTVFLGTVLTQRDLRSDNTDDGWRYRVRVDRAFRGAQGEEVEIFTENNSDRFPLEVHHQYLLFASKVARRLEITNCGNSGLATERVSEIGAIGDLPKGPTLVEGNVERATSQLRSSLVCIRSFRRRRASYPLT
jgi:hypothetical protein